MESYRHLWEGHFQRRLIQDAMLKSELLERWSFGQPGWSLPDCADDRQVGGAFPWVWRGPDGQEMENTAHAEVSDLDFSVLFRNDRRDGRLRPDR